VGIHTPMSTFKMEHVGFHHFVLFVRVSWLNYITYCATRCASSLFFYFLVDFFATIFLKLLWVSNVHLLQGHLLLSKPYDSKFYPYYALE